MKVRVNTSYSQLERWGWTAVKGTFVIVVLSLVLNPTTKGRSEGESTGPETVLPAQIRPGDLYTVQAETGGRMAQLHVQPGDSVQAGQLLAVIDNPEIESLIGRAERRVAITASRLGAGQSRAAAVKSPANSPQRLWLTEQLTASERTLAASRQRLEAFSLAGAEQAVARAQAAVNRIRPLAQKQLATAREVEDAERQLENERVNLNARREQRQRLEQELEAAQSQARMARLQLDSLEPAGQPAAPEASSAQLEHDDAVAALEALQARKAALRLVAPRPGTVLQVNAESGSAVSAGVPLFQIANTATLHFDVAAPATIARNVYAGQRVLVRVPADPPFDVPATVSGVLLQPDPGQQAYRIRITIPNPAPQSMLVGLEGGVSFPH